MSVERTTINRDDDGLAWLAFLACPSCHERTVYRHSMTHEGER